MFDSYKDEESFKEASGYTIDGIWYPRVTKIVSIKSKPALLYFYAEAANYKTGQAVTQKSAEEGTLVHNIIEGLLLDKNPVIEESVRPSIEAFQKFWEEKNIQVTPELVEKRVVSFDHRYAGTVDSIALIDGKLGVLDIKTSQAIYRDYNLQTAAYMEALKHRFQNLQTRWILRVDQVRTCGICGAILRAKGGREKVRIGKNNRNFSQVRQCSHEWSEVIGEIELKEFPYWQTDFEAFLGAKKLWEWENEYWLKRVGYI